VVAGASLAHGELFYSWPEALHDIQPVVRAEASCPRQTPGPLPLAAIGTLPHQHGPMVRVDAPCPAKIGASTRVTGVNHSTIRIEPVAGTAQPMAIG